MVILLILTFISKAVNFMALVFAFLLMLISWHYFIILLSLTFISKAVNFTALDLRKLLKLDR